MGLSVARCFGLADYSRYDEHVEVSRVVRVQNPALWQKYVRRREQIRREIGLAVPASVRLNSSMATVDAQVNEVHLFHGQQRPQWIMALCTME